MSSPAVVLFVMVVIMAALGLTWTVLYLLARVKAMKAGIADLRDTMAEPMTELRERSDVMRRELDRLDAARRGD